MVAVLHYAAQQRQQNVTRQEPTPQPGAQGQPAQEQNLTTPQLEDKEWLKEMRTGLMVMASVILACTYQAGVNIFQQHGEYSKISKIEKFQVFRITNTLAFAQSILVIMFLLSRSSVHKLPQAVIMLRLWLSASLMTLAVAYLYSDNHHTHTLLLLLPLQFYAVPFIFIMVVIFQESFKKLLECQPVTFCIAGALLIVIHVLSSKFPDSTAMIVIMAVGYALIFQILLYTAPVITNWEPLGKLGQWASSICNVRHPPKYTTQP